DTVLNLGMNQRIVRGLASGGNSRFAADCYRRVLWMFGEIVLGIPRSFFDEIHAKVKDNFGWGGDRAALEMLCDEYRAMIELITDHPVTHCPRKQLEQAMIAVLASWNNPRALAYRQAQRIGNGLGTAVIIQAMVF